mmetsp:Transcript_33782/g.81900  ORF Transcript_33782/g.81900 Transcript_33782/m.81900 type:complete len:204 (-) Transcript_33782:1837-2448(-)
MSIDFLSNSDFFLIARQILPCLETRCCLPLSLHLAPCESSNSATPPAIGVFSYTPRPYHSSHRPFRLLCCDSNMKKRIGSGSTRGGFAAAGRVRCCIAGAGAAAGAAVRRKSPATVANPNPNDCSVSSIVSRIIVGIVSLKASTFSCTAATFSSIAISLSVLCRMACSMLLRCAVTPGSTVSTVAACTSTEAANSCRIFSVKS